MSDFYPVLIKVAFQEGQLVHEGQLLAEIDPRPFEVQMEQAKGQQAKDVAQLNNAKVDLARYQTLMAAAGRRHHVTRRTIFFELRLTNIRITND